MGLAHFPADPETENASPYQADGRLQVTKMVHTSSGYVAVLSISYLDTKMPP
jgi:hypothetical protein